MEYASLHNSSYYSIMRAINKPADIIAAAEALEMPAVAITDYCTLAGIWEAYKAAKKTKLIVGCALNFTDDSSDVVKFNNDEIDKKPEIDYRSFVLLAKNAIGYKNLLMINFHAGNCCLDKNSKMDKIPLVDWKLIEAYSEGLICLTGSSDGIVAKHLITSNKEKAIQEANKFKELFGDDFFFELQPNNTRGFGLDQFSANRALFRLSKELGIKCVAASNAFYTDKDKSKLHNFLLAVKYHRSYKNSLKYNTDKPGNYLHTREEVISVFSRNFGEDFAKELCNNSIDIINRCEKPDWIKPAYVTGDTKQLPDFPVKDAEDYGEFLEWSKDKHLSSSKDDDKYMRFLCEKLWKERVPQGKDEEYRDRLNKEFEVYEQLGFSSYMLIIADFLNWARKNGITVGPGRGSVGGSLIGYLLNIHQADPIKYGLIFERFLNMEKKEYPDIDLDIDSFGRDKALNYVYSKYGYDNVAHVSNFVSFTPKNALTDVISCLEIGGNRSEAFRIAKNITETISGDTKTIKAAIEESALLNAFVQQYPEIQEFSEMLIGLPRSYSTHAAGVVIGKYKLLGLVPLRYDDHGQVALEFEKTRTEENGLVKMDFLGIETLNIIVMTNNIAKDLGLPEPENPPQYDKYYKEVYDMISNGDTQGVFQLGTSGGTMDLCKRVQPKNLEDLAVINALTRPGVPTAVRDSYILRKFGKEAIEIPHKNLIRAVKDTMGYCIFEESFLWLAHDFCGWDLQKSDKMRKISKLKAKGKHLLDELHGDYMLGATKHSEVNEEFASHIWDEWIIPLSGYAFNKSHAILYSMTSLHTAYLKALYPEAFLVANLISATGVNNPRAKEKVVQAKQQLKKIGVNIIPPNINLSGVTYKLQDQKTLITGFCALFGVKEAAAENIIKNRPYASFEDFLVRTDSSLVSSAVIDALIACGALDCFKISRKSMFLYASDLRKKLKAAQKNINQKKLEYSLPKEDWSAGEKRAMEIKYLGEALSGNKKDSFPALFIGRNVLSVKEACKMPNKEYVAMELEIVDLFTFKVKNKESKIYGQEVCKTLCEDVKGHQINVVFFPEAFQEFKDIFDRMLDKKAKLDKGLGIRISGNINQYNNEVSIIANNVYAIFVPTEMPNCKQREKIQLFTKKTKEKAQEMSSEDIAEDLLSIIDI